jgi:hypothetical protein
MHHPTDTDVTSNHKEQGPMSDELKSSTERLKELLSREPDPEADAAFGRGVEDGKAARENKGRRPQDAIERAYEDFEAVWYDKQAGERERILAQRYYSGFKEGAGKSD